ncbi:MAG: glutaredoxin family protein [Clostridia bacterium]|nr:glutaredoxin family protein [Clostridia bacterium]
MAQDLKITIYTQPGCGDCRRAKMFFEHCRLAYTEKNIQADPQALAELEKLGSQTLATVVIGDEVFPGFMNNLYKIKDKLGLE